MLERLRALPPSLVTLAALHVLALFADPLAPYPAGEQHRDRSYAPPTRLHLVDSRGRWHLVPFAYPLPAAAGGSCGASASAFPLRLFPTVSKYRIAGVIPATHRLFGVDEPAHLFLLGTDRYGRDLFSRLLLGARLSLFAGLVATLIALALGVAVGAASGIADGWPDTALSWLASACLSLPWMYLLVAVRGVLPLDLAPAEAFFATAGVIGLLGWGRPAVLVRASVRAERCRDYVLAARSCGASPLRVLVRHVLPQSSGVILTQAALMAPRCVLAEITLSFLGVGVGEPTASWGTLAAGMIPPAQVLAHWWLASPLIAIAGLFALYDLAARHLERQPTSAGPAGREVR